MPEIEAQGEEAGEQDEREQGLGADRRVHHGSQQGGDVAQARLVLAGREHALGQAHVAGHGEGQQ